MAVVVVALVVAVSSRSSRAAATRRSRRASRPHDDEPQAEAAPTAPLTGLPDKSGESFTAARGHGEDQQHRRGQAVGVDQADVVYEEVVEGGITRLAAIFNSHAPDRVGPVRSVRRTDQSIVWPIGGVFVLLRRRAVRDRQHQHRAR